MYLQKNLLLCIFAGFIQNGACQNLIKNKQKHISFEIAAGMLPQVSIDNSVSKYKLRSYIQSCYDIGFNYHYYIKRNFAIITGLHFMAGKTNYFANLSPADVFDYNGQRIVEEKDLWEELRIPLFFEKKIYSQKWNGWLINAGFNLHYSGINQDLETVTYILDPNNRLRQIFNSYTIFSNNKNIWVTCIAGAGKNFIFRKRHMLSVHVKADISNTNFLKGTWSFTVPNQPKTTGTYKVTGSAAILSIQYFFNRNSK